MPHIIIRRGQTSSTTINYIHGTGIADGSNIFTGSTDAQVITAVSVKITSRQGRAETVTSLRYTVDPGTILIP